LVTSGATSRRAPPQLVAEIEMKQHEIGSPTRKSGGVANSELRTAKDQP